MPALICFRSVRFYTKWRRACCLSRLRLLQRNSQRQPVPPVRINPDIPAKLEVIIHKALEKDRNLRYQHAADMRADLQRLKRDTDSGRPASAGTSVGTHRRSKTLERNCHLRARCTGVSSRQLPLSAQDTELTQQAPSCWRTSQTRPAIPCLTRRFTQGLGGSNSSSRLSA